MTNKEGHYKLWDELARTGGRSKRKIFDALFPELDTPTFDLQCFACVEDDKKWANKGCKAEACFYCPITNADNTCCNGFFDEWRLAKTKKERKRLAAIIRDLPWREKP
jgi:hypothetical protein